MIEVQNVTKVYPNGKGIFEVSFNVAKGEVFGFLGPNGAGKTTTIRQLMGFTNADKGTCTINGLDTRKDTKEVQKYLGYVPGEITFFENLTGKQFLNFLSDLRKTENSKKRNDLIEYFELDDRGKIRKMSKGMKQKLSLVAACMHDPEVLILDEPTSGLDPLMQRRFIQYIRQEQIEGKTILMSSHLFDEVDKTCQRAAIIREGKIVALESLDKLKSQVRKSFFVTLGDQENLEILKSSGLDFHLLDNPEKAPNDKFYRIEIFVQDTYDIFLTTLSKCKVLGIDAPSQNLEQIFIQYYGQERK